MTIGNFSGLYPNYPMYTNTVYPSTNPIGKDEANPNAVDPSADPDKVKKPGKRSSPEDCETCANRKYQDGSDENVSFKTASHISPESAGARVRAHEGEHVSNAYKKAAQKDGKVLNASVSIHTSICPECGRTYVAGGVTNTTIKYSNEDNPYTKNQRQLDATKFRGANIDYAA
ncbi:MAG: hypothetical protein K1W16_11955 [Lachnospiraceae bacterium]